MVLNFWASRSFGKCVCLLLCMRLEELLFYMFQHIIQYADLKKKTYYAVSAWIPSIRFWDHKLLVTDEFKLVCSKFDCRSYSLSGNDGDLSQVSEKILLFENDDQLDQMLMNEISQEKMKSNLLQDALNESLCSWLLQKIAKGVKDPNVLDESGRGILHFEASLGYNLQLWV